MMNANIDNEEDHHQQAAFTARRRRLHLELTTVLQQTEEFPFRLKNKSDELVQIFLHAINTNIDSEEDLHHQQAAAAVANDDDSDGGRRRRRLELITVLQQTEEFPFRYENKIDQLVKTFLDAFKNDTHNMICECDHGDGNYQGLDSDRDTKAEFETVLRLFPDVMTRRKEIVYYEDDDDEEGQVQLVTYRYPIEFLAWTAKAVSFLPLVASLAIELGLFDEQQRGGLLCLESRGNIVLHYLMMTDKIDSQEHHESVDTKYLQVLIQLRKLGLLKKEDIKSYGLLSKLCDQNYFAEKRIRFLVEWDPSALLHPEQRDELLPLHYAIGGCPSPAIQRLQFVFEYGIHYFPKKKGISLLFKKNNHGRYTPFQYACKKFGEEQVIKMIEDTFIRYYSSSDDTPPLNVVDALMTAAIDEGIHLDCVYFLLRGQPDILQKLLSSASISTTAKATVDMMVFTSNGNGINPKKRKR